MGLYVDEKDFDNELKKIEKLPPDIQIEMAGTLGRLIKDRSMIKHQEFEVGQRWITEGRKVFTLRNIENTSIGVVMKFTRGGRPKVMNLDVARELLTIKLPIKA